MLRVGRGLVLLVVAGFLLKLTLAVSLGNILERRAPALALHYAPTDPEALMIRSSQYLQRGTPRSIRQARQLALAALRRSPVKASAYSVLGYAADSDHQPAQSQRLLNLALKLSRRDLLTHLWFIEKYSAQGDIPQTLRHYDMALKTSADAHTILLPVLINAATDSAIQTPLTNQLANDPSWGDIFLREFIAKTSDPGAAALLAQRLRRAGHPLNPDRQLQLLERLVANQRFSEAATVMGLANRASVFDGDFRRTDAIGPFAWSLTNNFNYGAAREERSSQVNRPVLTFFADRSGGGEVARQLLVLPAGHYRLSIRASYAPRSGDAPPFWQLACADGAQRPIVTLAIPTADAPTETASLFSVPAACAGQWLTLQMRAPAELDRINGQVDWVAITKAG